MSPSRQSAGLVMYRRLGGELEVFLVHPGGPFFSQRDSGGWSVPKGVIEDGEEPFHVALREFAEETGQTAEACGASHPFLELGSVVQRGGKRVHAWAFEGDWPPGADLVSNTFKMIWPPRSGKLQEFPEVDEGRFFDLATARDKINSAQAAFLVRLEKLLG